MVSELEGLDPDIEYFVVPPLCPLVGSPYDFLRTSDHIERAIQSTDAWLAQSGLEQSGIPHQMRPHTHCAEPRPSFPRERKCVHRWLNGDGIYHQAALGADPLAASRRRSV